MTINQVSEPSPSLPTPSVTPRRIWWQRLSWYAAGVLISLIMSCFFLDLANNDIYNLPASYNGDYLLNMTVTQAALQQDSIYHIPGLGAPFGLEMHDFPMPECVHYWTLKVLGKLLPGAFTPLNYFYFLGFPAITLTTMFALRRLQFRPELALLGGLLYTFLPYHFLRLDHVILATYYQIPLAALVVLLIAVGKPLVWEERADGRWYQIRITKNYWMALGGIAVAILLGSTGLYYAYFTCYFLLIAGVMGWILRSNIASLLNSLLLIVFIVAVILLNVWPTLAYRSSHGANVEIVQRSTAESETYGLKLAQLLGPRPDDRWGFLAQHGQQLLTHPLNNENNSSTLGLALSVGFLFLLGVAGVKLAGGKPKWLSPQPLLCATAMMTLAGILLGTVGGMGTLVALWISPAIRSLNRISIFIAFWSVIGLLQLLAWLLAWAETRSWPSILKRVVIVGVPVLVLGFGLWSQVTPSMGIHQAFFVKKIMQDKEFTQKIEAVLPNQAAVYQLPYIPFPENGGWMELGDYEHLRYSLMTNRLRFSYGAERGRGADLAIQQLHHRPIPQMLEAVVCAGYDGILIEERGYMNRQAPTQEIATALGETPIYNQRHDAAFFDLRTFKNQVQTKLGAAQFTAAQDQFKNLAQQKLLKIQPEAGVWQRDIITPDISWYLCRNRGSFTVVNPNREPITVRITGIIEPAQAVGGNITLGGLITGQTKMDHPINIDETKTLLPGNTTLNFLYDGPPAMIPNDYRSPIFLRFINLRVITTERNENNSDNSRAQVPSR